MTVEFHQVACSTGAVSTNLWYKSNPYTCWRGRKVDFTSRSRIFMHAVHREVAFLINVEGENALSSGNLSKAEAIYTRAIRHNPKDTILLATALGKRGLSFSLRSKWDNAVKDYTRALNLRVPDQLLFSRIRYNRGFVFSMVGRHADAISDYDQALFFGDENVQAQARYNRGWAHYALEHWKEAADDFLAVADFYSGDRSKLEEIYYHAGFALFHLNADEEAEKQFTFFIDLDPPPASLGKVLAARGVIYLKQGKYPEAMQDTEKAFGLLQNDKIKKHFASVCYTAAIHYYKSEQWDEASSCFAKAYELYPTDKIKGEWANTLYLLGKVYYKQEKYSTATLAFQKVGSLEPSKEVVSAAQFKLGLIHFKQGRFKEALSHFEIAKADSPSSNTPLIDRRIIMTKAALANPDALASPNATQPLTSAEETQSVGRISAAVSGKVLGVKRPREELIPISATAVLDIFAETEKD